MANWQEAQTGELTAVAGMTMVTIRRTNWLKSHTGEESSMLFWLIILTIYLGLVVFSQAMKHSWEQWYYGRLNRRTLEHWSN